MKRFVLLFVALFLLLGTSCSPAMPVTFAPEGETATSDVPSDTKEEATREEETKEAMTREEETVPQAPVPERYCIENVPLIGQKPKYPTGCESASAVMVLQHRGLTLTMDDFINLHLEKAENGFELRGGRLYGPDPYRIFVGSPTDPLAFGCMAPVIEAAMNRALGNEGSVKNLTGQTMDQICREQIARGKPVLTWTTIGMLPTKPGLSWYLDSGEIYYWPEEEHCMVLVGYTEKEYIFHDPWQGKKVSYPKALAQSRFEALGSQALVIE